MPPRRIVPIAVNPNAKTSMAMRKIINHEMKTFKTGRERVRAMRALKNIIRNAYRVSLNVARPSVSAYQRRAATPAGFRLRGENLNRLLFGKKNKN